MAVSRSQRTTLEESSQSEEAGAPSPDRVVEEGPTPPTLTEAFYTLCAALQAHLDDNLTAATHLDEVQAWMSNAGADYAGRVQQALAWGHAVQVLEGVLGVPVMQR